MDNHTIAFIICSNNDMLLIVNLKDYAKWRAVFENEYKNLEDDREQ